VVSDTSQSGVGHQCDFASRRLSWANRMPLLCQLAFSERVRANRSIGRLPLGRRSTQLDVEVVQSKPVRGLAETEDPVAGPAIVLRRADDLRARWILREVTQTREPVHRVDAARSRASRRACVSG